MPWLNRVWLYWTNKKAWHAEQCRLGYHDCWTITRDHNHFVDYCRWCPHTEQWESWGE